MSVVAWRGLPLTVCAITALAAVGFSACSGALAPRIDAITPSRLASGAEAQLLITGTGFQNGDTVWLDSTRLGRSVWVNSRVLSATISTSLSPGAHDIAVATADGHRVTKRGALLVGNVSATPTATATETPTVRSTPRPVPTERATLPPAPTTVRPRPTAPPTPSPTPTATATPDLGPPAAFDVSGHWSLVDSIQDTPSPAAPIVFRDIVLSQAGNQVTGTGDGIVSLQGVLSGRTLTARYTAYDGTSGEFVWTFSADDMGFSGTFNSSAPNHGASDGRLRQRGP